MLHSYQQIVYIFAKYILSNVKRSFEIYSLLFTGEILNSYIMVFKEMPVNMRAISFGISSVFKILHQHVFKNHHLNSTWFVMMNNCSKFRNSFTFTTTITNNESINTDQNDHCIMHKRHCIIYITAMEYTHNIFS